MADAADGDASNGGVAAEDAFDGGLLAEVAGLMNNGREDEDWEDEEEEIEEEAAAHDTTVATSTLGSRVSRGAATRDRDSRSSNSHLSSVRKLFIRFMKLPEMQREFGHLGDNLDSLDLDKLQQGPTLYNLTDKFALFLAETDALKKTGKYSKQACDNYFSAFKGYLSQKLVQTIGNAGILGTDKLCSKIRKGMLKVVEERCIAENVATSKGHKVASIFDLIGLSILLIWVGTSESCEFLFLIMSLFQLAGRGSEVAKIQHKNVGTVYPGDMQVSGPGAKPIGVFSLSFWRDKNRERAENLSIFPHRDDMRLDWTFLWGLHLVMMDDWSENLFPAFYEKASQFQEDQHKSNKGLSEFFKTLLKKFIGMAGHFSGEEGGQVFEELGLVRGIQSGLSMHSGKKAAVNEANTSATLSTTWVCFRAGWIVKMIHSIFDYLVNNQQNDQQVGMFFSGWRTKNAEGRLGGGFPPRIRDAIDIDGDGASKLESFRNALFFMHRGEGKMDDEGLSRITASVVMYLPTFIELLRRHPLRKYGEEVSDMCRKHKFLASVNAAAVTAELSFEDLLDFSAKIEKDFVSQNLIFANSVQYFDAVGEERVTIDSRPMMQYMQGTNELLASQEMHIRHLRRELQQANFELQQANFKINQLEARDKRIETKIDSIFTLLTSRGGEAVQVQEVATEQQEQEPQRILTNELLPTSLKDLLATSAYKNYHIFDYASVWEEKKNTKVKLGKGESANFSAIKRLVEHANIFRQQHVPPLPDDAVNGRSEKATQWRDELKESTDATFAAIQQFAESRGKDFDPEKISASNATKAIASLLEEDGIPTGPADASTFQNAKVSLRSYNEIVADKEKKNAGKKRDRDEEEG